MLNKFFDGGKGKVGWVTSIFSYVVWVTEKKSAKGFHSFKLLKIYIVAIRFFLAHYVHLNFFNIIPLLEPVWDTCCLSNYGCGCADWSKFVRCVDVRDPEVHEVITPKVHPAAQIDVDHWITHDFATNHFTETGFRTAMFVKKSMNGSFEFLGSADQLRNRSPYWINNILFLSPRWGVWGTVESLALESKPVGCYSGDEVPWRGAILAPPAYLPQCLENARTTARRVHDNLLWEHRLVCAPKSLGLLEHPLWKYGQ